MIGSWRQVSLTLCVTETLLFFLLDNFVFSYFWRTSFCNRFLNYLLRALKVFKFSKIYIVNSVVICLVLSHSWSSTREDNFTFSLHARGNEERRTTLSLRAVKNQVPLIKLHNLTYPPFPLFLPLNLKQYLSSPARNRNMKHFFSWWTGFIFLQICQIAALPYDASNCKSYRQ